MNSLDESFTENTFGDLSYTFLEPVPNYLTCIICYGLLEEPVATECCGKMFCYEHSPHTNRVCPACRHAPLVVSRNKGIDTIVKDLKVFCQHRGEGCPWSGHLCFEPDHRNSTCEFEVVHCSKGCRVDMQRRQMETHLLEDCPRRQVKCEFCQVPVTVTKLKTHHESCPECPVGCPHGCELTMPRKKVEEHSSTCPELPVPCPFAGAGCSQLVKNKDLSSHIRSSVVEHLLLVSAENVSIRKDLEAENASLRKELEAENVSLHKELEAENVSLRKELEADNVSLRKELEAENVSLRKELETIKGDHAAVKLEMQLELRLMKKKCDGLEQSLMRLQRNAGKSWSAHLLYGSASVSDKLPMIFKFNPLKKCSTGTGIYSPRVYTCSDGYRVCLVMFPSGLELKFSNSISVTVLALPGIYDDALQWPMEGSLNVEILNQLGDHSHFSKTIDFARLPKKFRKRPKQDPTKDGECGWGIARFIDHSSLFAITEDCCYMVNETVYVRVTSGD